MRKILLICFGLLISTGAMTYVTIIPEPIKFVCNGEYNKSGKTKLGKLLVLHIKYHILKRVLSDISRSGEFWGSEGVMEIETVNGYFESFYYLRGGNYMVISKNSPSEISNDIHKRADNIKGTYMSLSGQLSLRTTSEGLFTGECNSRKINKEKEN